MKSVQQQNSGFPSLLQMWTDGIPKNGKREIIDAFKQQFGLTGHGQLLYRLKGERVATPKQAEFLQDIIPKYFAHFNPDKTASK